jgi:hypothetical protein
MLDLRFSQRKGYREPVALTAETLARRIQEAIRASGIPQHVLAQELGIDPSAFSRSLSGQRSFKPVEVSILSERLGLPIGDLLRDPDKPAVRASIAARAQPDEDASTAEALYRANQMLDLDDLLTEVGFPDDPASPTHPARQTGAAHQQGERLAEAVRTYMGIGNDDLPPDIGDLADDLERHLHINVAIEPFGRGLDGVAVSRGAFRLILARSSIPAHRQRYTIAHELGHLIAGDGDQIIDENINFA